MKYILTYTAKRKNAKRHVWCEYGKVKYFDSIEEAKSHNFFNHPLYNVEVLTSNYKKVEG